MDFQQAFETIPSNGWLTKEEAEILWDAAQKTEGDILEVGSYYGRSSVLLAQTGRKVYCVDPFDNFASEDPSGDIIEKGFKENTKDFKNVVLFRQRVEDWEVRPIGFAYLDGDHTYKGTKRQIEIALQCKPKIIACHDYCNDGGGREIVKATEDFSMRLLKHVGRMAIFEV